jgi:hypothetical protein
VVFHKAGYYGDGGGPMVRWVGGRGMACNVYQGDVLVPAPA